jgi:anti-anti-sigma factor
MPHAPLQVTIRKQNNTAILELAGEIDASADPALMGAFANARALNPEQVLINFGGVGYINSTGIAIIVAILAQARREKLPVLVCGLSEHYQEIFRITRLSDFMQIFPDESSALSQ